VLGRELALPFRAMSDKSDASSLVHDSIAELIEMETKKLVETSEAEKTRKTQSLQHAVEERSRAQTERANDERATIERAHAQALRRRVEEARLEGAKHADQVVRALSEAHRRRMEQLDHEHAMRKQYWLGQQRSRRSVHPSALFAVLLALFGAVCVLVYVTAMRPPLQAKEAIAAARSAASSDDPARWEEATLLIAVARNKDPHNFEAIGVEETILAKRKALDEQRIAEQKKLEEAIVKLRKAVAEKQKVAPNPPAS